MGTKLKQMNLFPQFEVDRLLDEADQYWDGGFDLRDAVVAMFSVGSQSHGTYIPPTDPNGIDDEDVMIIVIPPAYNVLGLKPFSHRVIKQGTLDCVIYDWRKYVGLLIKSNPNVLGTLWLQPGHWWMPENSPFKELRTFRAMVASKTAYPAFVGYAKAQLYKMTHHAHEGYMGEKRKKLVEKFGYDVKNAAHLIRLLRMAVEFLETGEFQVYRKDAEELKAIKRGEWTLERIKEEAEQLFIKAEVARDNSRLATGPSYGVVETILTDGYQHWWSHRKGQDARNS